MGTYPRDRVVRVIVYNIMHALQYNNYCSDIPVDFFSRNTKPRLPDNILYIFFCGGSEGDKMGRRRGGRQLKNLIQKNNITNEFLIPSEATNVLVLHRKQYVFS